MLSTFAEGDAGRQTLTIKLDWDEVAADYDDILKLHARLPIQGFRPGKAPRAMIERRYASELQSGFTAQCPERFVRDAMSEADVHPAGHTTVEVSDLVPDGPVTLTCRFLPEPDFQLPDYRRIPLTSPDDEERRDDVSEWLLAQTDITLANALIEDELLYSDVPEGDEEALASEREQAEQRVRLILVLSRIAREDGIEVEEQDIDDRISAMAPEYGMPESELRAEMVRNGGLTRLRKMLLAEMVLDYLLDANPIA